MIKKALVFYISRYSGHFHAACAIEKGLVEVVEDIEVDKVNALSYTNPILEKVINKAYMEVIKKKPKIWGDMYDNPEVMKKTKKVREVLHKFNVPKIKKLIDAYAPDIIYCTQAFPCGMTADYKRIFNKDILLVGVLTDYAPHSYWLFDEVNFYVVPSEETARVLERKGVSADKIKVLGIPVDPKFGVTHDATKIRKKMELSKEKPTILIMGGSQGLGAVETIVRSLLTDTEHAYQILVVAGSNRKLFSRLRRLKKRKQASDRVRILSFVDNIDELMEISDIIVTKAGGMTVAEAQVKKLPMLLVDPIPGHEQMNTDYLVGKGAAVEVKKGESVHGAINKLFDSKDTLPKMRKNLDQLGHPNSALDVAKLIFEK